MNAAGVSRVDAAVPVHGEVELDQGPKPLEAVPMDELKTSITADDLEKGLPPPAELVTIQCQSAPCSPRPRAAPQSMVQSIWRLDPFMWPATRWSSAVDVQLT